MIVLTDLSVLFNIIEVSDVLLHCHSAISLTVVNLCDDHVFQMILRLLLFRHHLPFGWQSIYYLHSATYLTETMLVLQFNFLGLNTAISPWLLRQLDYL